MTKLKPFSSAHPLSLFLPLNPLLCLPRVSSIRHFLSTDTTKTLVFVLVLSKIDYCNSLCYGCPLHLLEKLQKVQNSAARLVLKARKRDHVKPSELSTGYVSKLVLTTSCQHSVLPSSHPQPLSTCLSVYSP